MGKKLISKPVAAGIRRQKNWSFQTILDGKADVFHAENAAQASASQEKYLGGAFTNTPDEWVSQMSHSLSVGIFDRPCLLDWPSYGESLKINSFSLSIM